MKLVKDAKWSEDGNGFPVLKVNDYLYKETNNEREVAMVIVQRIVDKEELTWKSIDQELSERQYADWYDPGRVIDISYLAERA
jgi:hypothetical protein